MELVRSQINFPDISSMDRETRSDAVGAAVKPAQAAPWLDTIEDEPPHIHPTAWTDAIGERATVHRIE
jgi:hypothetical protein